MPDPLRITIAPVGARAAQTWRATLGDLVLLEAARRPLLEGARALVALGYDPATPLTMRRAGTDYDVFRPVALGTAARLTTSEGDADSIRFRKWAPFTGPARSAGTSNAVGPDPDPAAIALPGDAEGRQRAKVDTG